MLVIRNLNEDNSFNRVDILGLSKDDFYLIERGVESLLKTQDGYKPETKEDMKSFFMGKYLGIEEVLRYLGCSFKKVFKIE